jgi:hypothetical protein
MRKLQPSFGAAVTRVLQERGLSQRSASYQTGIDRFTLADMQRGVVPKMEKVLQFARSFGLDENEWLELSGYGRVGEESGAQILAEGLLALYRKHHRPIPVEFQDEERITPEGARQILRVIKQQIDEGTI